MPEPDDLVDIAVDLIPYVLTALGVGVVIGGSAVIFYPNTNVPISDKDMMDSEVKKQVAAALEELAKEIHSNSSNPDETKDKPDISENTQKVIWKSDQGRIDHKISTPDFSESIEKALEETGTFSKLPTYFSKVALKAVFIGINNEFKNKKLPKLDHFTLDIPIKDSNGDFRLTRLHRFMEKEVLDFHALNSTKEWRYPMFPRLYFKEENALTESPLPKSAREEIMRIFRRHISPDPLTPKEKEVLKIFLENQGLSSAQVATKMSISPGTVSDYLKNIGKKAIELTGIAFNPTKTFSLYWHELGLSFTDS